MTKLRRQGTLDEVVPDRDLVAFNRLFAFLSGSACSLDTLIARVEDRARADDAPGQVRVAAVMAAELAQTSDRLIGCFVDRARKAGSSWSDIGQALDVTKQAAHERFIGPDLNRLTDRAGAAVVLASAEANRLGYRWVAPGHILLGLLVEAHGIAARALRGLGLSPEALRAAVKQVVPGGGEAGPGEQTPPMSPQAMRLVGEAAVTSASALGHNYVGTEHLLLALCTHGDPLVGQILTALGVTADLVKSEVFTLLSQPRGATKSP